MQKNSRFWNILQIIRFIRLYSHELEIHAKTLDLAKEHNFEVRAFSFDAKTEELRSPRIVRVSLRPNVVRVFLNYSLHINKHNTIVQVAAVQHSIVKPTTDKIQVQRDAIFEKIAEIVRAAAASDVNILCLQEAWSKCCYYEKYIQLYTKIY